jgi:hypothetical protein
MKKWTLDLKIRPTTDGGMTGTRTKNLNFGRAMLQQAASSNLSNDEH